ncbi:MAG: hypothetical protein CSA20_03105 [Deltaproteobacteria bacterium]|nr:MAG: hypothetical protein CSA20_03105 [Deltaproteobacteria bacterium]
MQVLSIGRLVIKTQKTESEIVQITWKNSAGRLFVVKKSGFRAGNRGTLHEVMWSPKNDI